MISFLKPITSRLSRFWKECPELAWGIALFAALIAHGASVGISDDEAYYWVLAQKPAWGYAYHPPMVAWMIALSQRLIGGLTGPNAPIVVRLPAALCSSAVFSLALVWLRELGIPRERLALCAASLLSLAGLFFLSWMMVPDLPLFLGWMIAFVATWRIAFSKARQRDFIALWALAAATCLAILSKYSGILIALSSGLCFLIYAPRERKWKAIAFLILGCALAAVPIVLWNAAHEWGSILYQVRDRHEGASVSWPRFGRFWTIELFAGGPFLILWGFAALLRPRDNVTKFLLIWAAPAAIVFCLQPLLTDFKPHWALVVWWPMALALALRAGQGTVSKHGLAFQIRYGFVLGALVIVSCHLPIGNFLIYRLAGEKADPRWDVTNDLFGWSELPDFLKGLDGNANLVIPVVGSRYQTASQASFALGPGYPATLLPRDLKSRDEWPDLGLAESPGPDWPRLKRGVLFVADNRYDAPPEFPGARCSKVGRVEEDRAGFIAKWIEVWFCSP